MVRSPWKIEGFVTDAGNKPVQEWWDNLPSGDRQAVQDNLNYLVNLEKSQWVEPYFKWFGKIGEVRRVSKLGALRIYGTFDEDRRVFIFLAGHIKKANKDSQGIDSANIRLARLKSRRGATHEFDFEEKSAREDQKE